MSWRTGRGALAFKCVRLNPDQIELIKWYFLNEKKYNPLTRLFLDDAINKIATS